MRITKTQLRGIIREEILREAAKATIKGKEVTLSNYESFNVEDLEKLRNDPSYKDSVTLEKKKSGLKGPLAQLDSAIYELLKTKGIKSAKDSAADRAKAQSELEAKLRDDSDLRARLNKAVKAIKDAFGQEKYVEDMIKNKASSTWIKAMKAQINSEAISPTDPGFIKILNYDSNKITGGPLKGQKLGDAFQAALAGKLEKTGFFKRLFGEAQLRRIIRQEVRSLREGLSARERGQVLRSFAYGQLMQYAPGELEQLETEAPEAYEQFLSDLYDMADPASGAGLDGKGFLPHLRAAMKSAGLGRG